MGRVFPGSEDADSDLLETGRFRLVGGSNL